MKKCVACVKDLPDAAAHCVFCGVAQPAAARPPVEVARTVMGYSADDVRAAAAAAGRPATAPPVAAPMPMPTPGQAPTMMALQPPPTGDGRTRTAPPLQPAQPQPARSPLSSPAIAMPPPGASMPFAPPAPAPAWSPPAAPEPAPMLRPGRVTPSNLQGATIPMEAAPVLQPMAVPVGVPSRPAEVAHGVPVRRQTARAIPTEPNRTALRVVLAVFGVLLLGAFAVPVQVKPVSVFNWDALVASTSTAELVRILALVGGGALALVVALIPMPTVVRAVLALGLGLSVIGLQLGLGPTPEWQEVASIVGTLCLVVGLLLRHDYTESIGARLAVTVGALTVLAVYLVPIHGEVPLAAAAGALGSNRTVPALLVLVPAVLAVLSLLAWLGANTRAGAVWLAWLVLAWPVIAYGLTLLNTDRFEDLIAARPGTLVGWVPLIAWPVLACYGIAAMVAKKLER